MWVFLLWYIIFRSEASSVFTAFMFGTPCVPIEYRVLLVLYSLCDQLCTSILFDLLSIVILLDEYRLQQLSANIINAKVCMHMFVTLSR